MRITAFVVGTMRVLQIKEQKIVNGNGEQCVE